MTTLRITILKLSAGRWMKRIGLILALLLIPTTVFGQGAPVTGLAPWFAGPTGAPKAGAIIHICNYPSAGIPCTNYASVFSDIGLTVPINQVTNPITTDGLGNVPLVFVAPGTYAATLSGAGITSPQGPYTFSVSCIAGLTCGSVMSFSAGNLSPLFTSNVATPTTTPALSFALNSQSQNLFFASPNGSAGVPSFRSIVGADFGSQSANTFFAAPNGSPGNPTFRALVGADVPAVNLAASGNGGVTGILPGANMAATNLAGGNNPGGVTGVLPVANEGTGTPGAGKYVDGATGAWTALPTGGYTIYAVDQTGLSADLAWTTITTPGANGFYRISAFIVLTTAAGTSSTLPQCQVDFYDADSNTYQAEYITNTMTTNTVGQVGPVMVAAAGPWPFVFYAKSGQAIRFRTLGYVSSPAAAMHFAVHARLEGPF